MSPGATPTLPCSGIFGIPDPYPDSVRVAEVDDQRRMAAILAYDAVRMPPRAELLGVVELAARISGLPKATVNIITDTEQHQIATTGFEGSVSPRRDSMCAAILGAAQPVVVADASRDARFARNPSVTGQIDTIRCYVAHPLVTRDGVPVGTLCVFDSEARELGTEQLAGLALLAARTVDVFEVRLRGRELALSLMENQAVQAELERSNERLASFAGQVSHDLKTPLTTLSLTLSLIREQLEDGQVGAESTALLDRAIHVSERMADLIDDVLDYARLGGTFRATEVDLDFVLGKVLEDLAPELADVTLHIGQLPTVLGDAAHATGPVWAQGAAMAMEDAIALGGLLADHRDWSAVGAAWEAARRPRVQHVQEATDRMSRLAGLPSWLMHSFAPLLGPRAFRATYEPLRTPPDLSPEARTRT